MRPCRIPIGRVHQRLDWSPKWEGSIQQWAKSFIQQNLWRCDPINEFNDLLQDAYLIYNKICERYPRVIEARHFMALFQRALWNKFHDQARYMRLKRRVHEDTIKDVSELYADRIGERTNAGYLSILLADAPKELQVALAVSNLNPKRRIAIQIRELLTKEV